MAASQCPKCGHLFDVRDGFGELLPLAYCSTCDSYYPESLGACRWCGTKPAPPPIAPKVWKATGIALLCGVLMTGWLLRDSRPKHKADIASSRDPTLTPVADTPVPVDTMPLPKSIQTANGVRDRAQAGGASVASPGSEVPNVSPPTVSTGDVTPVSAQVSPPTAPPTARTVALPPGDTSAKPGAAPPPTPKASTRWVNSVSKGWVIVRAAPSKDSRIVASIGPDSRVQLGETRGTWRRIRARNISGWVEPRSSFAAGLGSARPRMVVER
jgi:hypothetical protein